MMRYLNKYGNKKYISLTLILALFISIVNTVVADVDQYTVNYNIPGGPVEPNITSWGNSKTQDNSQNININTGEIVKFNITADQTIDKWQWSKDGIIQSNNYDNFTTSWSTIGNKMISINGSNINGMTGTIIWNVTVNQLTNQTNLSACGILNEANSVYVLNSDVSSAGTCFTIGANNITLEGQGHSINYSISSTGYGIGDAGGYDNINIRNLTISQQNPAVTNAHAVYLRNVISSRVDNININTKNNAEGLYLISSSSNTLSNININTANNGAYGIYLGSSNSNIFSACNITTRGSNSDGIFSTASDSNSFAGCYITTMGSNSDGIYMISSNYNSYSGSNILTSGTGANGIWINTNTNYNNFTNMDILSSASGVVVNSGGSNIIKDGSIISKLANAYYLQNSTTNDFINTNFTTRKIYLADSSSVFNYANNNIMLKTKQIVSPSKVLTITRTLVNWSQTNMSWLETVSVSRTLNYEMSGLLPNSRYTIWNGSIISYNLSTDANGNLPNFNINLTTSSKSIRVISS